jgi:hypothetical protein
MSGDMGQLLPIGCLPILPGDTVRMRSEALIRFVSQAKPVMHPVQARIHHFYVPYRTIWSGWEDFITGVSSTAPPQGTGAAHVEGSLLDYLNYYDETGEDYNLLNVRAYNKIYNEFFRDQDLISEVSEDSTTVQNIAWAKDYFTAARSSPQQGSAVTLPLGTVAPVTSDVAANANVSVVSTTQSNQLKNLYHNSPTIVQGSTTQAAGSGLYADLTSATAATINELREAFALQKYAEARNIYGDNYVDYLRYLGIKPSDGRLQRAEMLSAGNSAVNFSEVLDTGSSAAGVGEQAGHGIAALRSNRFQRFFEEHGVIMSLLSVRPKSSYTQAQPRDWFKQTKEDYYQMELANIGDQEVYNKEIYAPHTTPGGVFGYSPRYDEYRSNPSYVAAEMRNATNYDTHLGRIFGSDPALNQTFVECSPSKRVFNEQTEDSMWIYVNNDIVARRPIQKRAGYSGV